MSVSNNFNLNEVYPGIGVIDCDTHYTEPANLWQSRAPARLKDRLPQMRRVDGRDTWFVDDNVNLGTIGLSIIDRHGEKVKGIFTLPEIEMMNEASHSVAPRLEIMNRLGVSHQIVYPNVAGFGSSRFLSIKDENLRMACVQIYNDAIAEMQADSKQRLVPQGILPFWNMPATIKEMRRIKEELKLTGVTIPDTPDRLGLPDFGSDHWNPFWECASDLRMPLNFHIGSADASIFMNAPWPSMGPERKMAIGASLLYMDNARVIVNLLYSDVIERYPKLRFVSVESGLGWIPFVIEACEYQWDEMVPTEVKHHRMRPREKFRNSIYACFWFEESGPKQLIDTIGVDRVLFESDFPHPTCLFPKSREHLQNVMAGHDATTRRRVLHDNAAELYGLT
jgi:predicted TIM-barrel fold metal-dependent hydrolase